MLKYITDFLLQGSSLVSDTLEEHDISLVALIPALFAVWFVGLLLYRWLLHPLAGIPGPFLAQFTGHWRNWHYLRGDWHDVIVDVHRKYGRVVRIAPNELSLVDEQAIRKLYSHGNHTEKTQWYATWDVPQTAPGLFATRDRKEHAFLRKRVSSAYSMTSLLKFEGYVQSCFDLLFEKLKKHAGEIVDMAEWTNAVAYDIVGELAYGEKLGHLQTETDVMGIRQAILDGFFLMANMGHYWGQSQIASNLFVAKITEMLGVPNNFSKFREWSVNKVRSRRQDMTKADRHDMLWHFMQMKDEKGNLASDPEVLIEAMNIMYV
jgi:cytochrome P450